MGPCRARWVMLAFLLATLPAGPATSFEPAPGAVLSRIAFGSCADQRLAQPVWDAVLAYRPDLFLFMGDNVYGDAKGADLSPLREAYARAAALPGWRRLRAAIPHLAIWDDHDYGKNDGGAEFTLKVDAKSLFLDFWRVPGTDARRGREGIYHARIYGPPGRRVQIIMLDTRSFRSALRPTDRWNAPGKERYLPDPDPTKTMLGPGQWAWLKRQLARPAEIRLIVSSIQVIATGHGYERWANLPAERKRLLDLIRGSGANGVILLSGDRHLGALYRLDDGRGAPIYEVTSSSLNRPFDPKAEAGPHRIGRWYGRENFGTASIDWRARALTLALHGKDGASVREERLGFDRLGIPAPPAPPRPPMPQAR